MLRGSWGLDTVPLLLFRYTKSSPELAMSHFSWQLFMMESWTLMILVAVPGVWGGEWSVTFGPDLCALKGTSVVMNCNYNYPSGHQVTRVSWSRPTYVSGQWRLVYLSSLASPPDHFQYVGNNNRNCNMKINDVQLSDEGKYHLSFVTTSDRWTSKTHARLSVKELTAAVQPSTVAEGDDVSLTCASGCPSPPALVWFRDGQRVLKPVIQARREDAGRYYCAVLGQETVRSATVVLNVQYISVSLVPEQAAEGSVVNLTCSAVANPAADNYTWYKRTDPPGLTSGSVLRVGSGQVLILPSVETSHAGLYHCKARNSVGEISSAELKLTVNRKEHGSELHLIIAGVGAFLLVTVVIALPLYRKQRTRAEKKPTVFDHGSSAPDVQLDAVYANVRESTAALDVASRPQSSKLATADQDEVTYSRVNIKRRNPSSPHHASDSGAPQTSWSKVGESDDSVIYATVTKSS